MKKLVFLVLAIALVGCESEQEKDKRLNGIGLGSVQKIVKNKLNDPQSAQFKNQVGFCGEVNSKNKMGGYGEFKKFSVLNSKDVIFENEANTSNGQFQKIWKETCGTKFKFNKEDVLLIPNFKLPDPVYSKAKYNFGQNFATATPSSLVIGDGEYIYPVLQIHCKGKSTVFNLYSMNTISYKMNNTVSIVADKQNMILVEVEDNNRGYQSFGEDAHLLSSLKNSETIQISFQTSSGGFSMQDFNVAELRKGMRGQSNSCEWNKL
ncbi:hypothetical protein [Acinetobacter sp. KS-LM10]|uniref:hypothetical protein n=1 Tax=Acinetobacter sp. KS-LM10 TaxID=3120518 RepID=UPI0030CB3DCA